MPSLINQSIPECQCRGAVLSINQSINQYLNDGAGAEFLGDAEAIGFGSGKSDSVVILVHHLDRVILGRRVGKCPHVFRLHFHDILNQGEKKKKINKIASRDDIQHGGGGKKNT